MVDFEVILSQQSNINGSFLKPLCRFCVSYIQIYWKIKSLNFAYILLAMDF